MLIFSSAGDALVRSNRSALDSIKTGMGEAKDSNAKMDKKAIGEKPDLDAKKPNNEDESKEHRRSEDHRHHHSKEENEHSHRHKRHCAEEKVGKMDPEGKKKNETSSPPSRARRQASPPAKSAQSTPPAASQKSPEPKPSTSTSDKEKEPKSEEKEKLSGKEKCSKDDDHGKHIKTMFGDFGVDPQKEKIDYTLPSFS